MTRPSALARRGLAAVIISAVCWPSAATAAPVLQSATALVTFSAPAACEVTLTLAITGAAEVEHRLEVVEGARVELDDVRGAARARPPREVGRTLQLDLTPPPNGTYSLHYRVTQQEARRYRCPLWVPTVAADGQSRRVRLEVTVPDGASAAGTMPAFAWTGPHGTAALPHLPAIVIVPFAAPGESRPWDVSRLMDLTAMASLAIGTAWWLRRQRSRR